jgi:hypothetical protein
MANKFKNVSLDTIALIFLNFSEFQSNNMLFEIVLKSYCEKFGKTKLKMTFKDFDRPRSPLTFINSNAARFTIIPEISLIEIKMFIPSIISALSESDKVYFNIEDFGDFYLKVINVMPKLKQKYPLAQEKIQNEPMRLKRLLWQKKLVNKVQMVDQKIALNSNLILNELN